MKRRWSLRQIDEVGALEGWTGRRLLASPRKGHPPILSIVESIAADYFEQRLGMSADLNGDGGNCAAQPFD